MAISVIKRMVLRSVTLLASFCSGSPVAVNVCTQFSTHDGTLIPLCSTMFVQSNVTLVVTNSHHHTTSASSAAMTSSGLSLVSSSPAAMSTSPSSPTSPVPQSTRSTTKMTSSPTFTSQFQSLDVPHTPHPWTNTTRSQHLPASTTYSTRGHHTSHDSGFPTLHAPAAHTHTHHRNSTATSAPSWVNSPASDPTFEPTHSDVSTPSTTLTHKHHATREHSSHTHAASAPLITQTVAITVTEIDTVTRTVTKVLLSTHVPLSSAPHPVNSTSCTESEVNLTITVPKPHKTSRTSSTTHHSFSAGPIPFTSRTESFQGHIPTPPPDYPPMTFQTRTHHNSSITAFHTPIGGTSYSISTSCTESGNSASTSTRESLSTHTTFQNWGLLWVERL